MKRKTIVRLIHDFLRTELREPEEADASPAHVLQDLFDCRVCAGHIIQVYVKGIMEGIALTDGRVIFDAEKEVSEEELTNIMTRVCFPEFRTPHRCEYENKNVNCTPEKFSLEQVYIMRTEEPCPLVVDVRTEREYAKGCFPGAVNVSVLDIMKNPFMFRESRSKRILLYCNEGYQSRAAARCLLENGYGKAAYFVWKQEEQ